jgi:divalent metal cation (Fe/Co/Zn/Cd) transporter
MVTLQAIEHKALRLERFTIFYNVLEGVFAITFGLVAGLVSLLAFGIDSAIEVTSATAVLVRLHAELHRGEYDAKKEKRALQIVALTFFALATYVLVESISRIANPETPETSTAGLIITGVSIVVMPWLARTKRLTGELINSRLLIADAAETRLCAWLSVSTFAGLAAYSAFGWTWLDAVAGLIIGGYAIVEGREAWRGELVCDDCECIGKCTC